MIAAILSGVATPLILDVIRGTDTPQMGTVWTGEPEFADSLNVFRGAGSTANTLLRERCRRITFAQPFGRPPEVLVALEMIDAGYDGIDLSQVPKAPPEWSPGKAFGADLERKDGVPLEGSPSVRVGVRTADIQTTGFLLCAFTWSNTRLHSANLTWLALPTRASSE